MNKAVSQFDNITAKDSVKHRVERDIASINQKIISLESEPRSNDQLLAAYRLMLKTRTEVLRCLTDTYNKGGSYRH
ncbi:hypothetical protein QWI17_09735 [Gilvimarinus sp. SDUM040013]|uniref:Uncharacterized protein n=1 Tax=Gilvimarinus gilvus TaxID=3058038 RepID=A0ABU4S4W7_9GAMM|nr:hypothetical protein [Gilvimarinus sp. SDUM040013]MDO3386115.1 hypothetical protein [Gilvimarinus sp. SDUM040013]MDX6850344.1 hypothetical protein [Gilvimarinus sp. SDUM040013]